MVWILVLVAPLLLPPFQKGVLCPQSANEMANKSLLINLVYQNNLYSKVLSTVLSFKKYITKYGHLNEIC